MACSGLAEDQLAASVHTYLGLLLFENAKFLCERLVASCASEVQHAGLVRALPCRVVDMHQLPTRCGNAPPLVSTALRTSDRHAPTSAMRAPSSVTQVTLHAPLMQANIHLLALCYFHCNQAHRSYHLLKASASASASEGGAASPSPASRYLLALCCLQLGKLSEAKEALSPSRCSSSPDGGQVPNGAAGHYLLGRVSRLGGRNTEAREHFVRALRLDPLMWSAYEELCAIGGVRGGSGRGKGGRSREFFLMRRGGKLGAA